MCALNDDISLYSLIPAFIQVMDEYWNTQVLEFGAINITGFRILQQNSIEYRQFLKDWRALDIYRWPGAGNSYISVSRI